MRKLRSEIVIPVSICAAILFVAWQIFTAEAQVRVNPTSASSSQTPTYQTVTATTGTFTGLIADSAQFSFLSVGHMSLTGFMSATALRVSNTGTFQTVISTSATFQGIASTSITLGGTTLSAWPAGSDLTNPGPIGSGTPSTGAFTTLTATSTSSGFIGVSGVSVVKSNDKGLPIWLGTLGGSATAYTATNIPNFTSAQLVEGASFVGIAQTSNSGTNPSLQINSTTAKTIVNGDGSALIAGDISVGKIHQFVYDGTNMQLLSPYGARSKTGFFSRAMNAASGTTTVSGIGFPPRVILFTTSIATALTNSAFSIGMYTEAGGYGVVQAQNYLGKIDPYTGEVVRIVESATSQQIATMGSITNDGWTMNWTQTGAGPSGNSMYISYIAVR